MSKLQSYLFEKVNPKDVMALEEGMNGLVAVTSSIVYLVRGKLLEKKSIKTYSISSISSIDLRKPSIFTRGFFQIISSGSGDRTKRTSSDMDLARDENTVMFTGASYDQFVKIEQLIYKLRDTAKAPATIHVTANNEDDALAKLEKLAKLRDQNVITAEEFEAKKAELLAKL
ncbi:SHOCT domain-containing protein [Paenibacillus marinisediminis]